MAAAAPLKSILTILIVCAGAWAQDKVDNSTPAETPSFRAGVNLVLVPVVVRDASGHTVGNLGPADFQLFDKGKRQTIESFSAARETASTDGSGPAELASGAPKESRVTRLAEAASGHSTPDTQPAARYIAYVFDDVNTPFDRLGALREAALRHFQHGFAAGGRAGIYTFSGRDTLGFTADRAKLETAAAELRTSLTVGHGDVDPCPDATYYIADLIVNQNDERALEAVTRQTMDCAHLSHFAAQHVAQAAAKRAVSIGEQDTRLWASTLRRAIRALAEQNGKRLLVLASAGFFTPTGERNKAVADTIDLAARANVTISTLDARGVYIPEPMDVTRSVAPSAMERDYYVKSAHANEDALAALAEGTGGTFVHNNNNLEAGLGRLAAPAEFSYVLAFAPGGLKADGSFHALKIRLPGRSGVTIQARPGYYAPISEKASRSRGSEAAIDDAVDSRDEVTSVPVDAIAQITRSGKAAAMVSVMAKIHVKTLPFQRLDGRDHDVLTVVSVLYDKDGGYVVGNRNTINLMLHDESLANKTDPAVNVQSDFAGVSAGDYRARVVVYDDRGHSLSTRNVNITVR